MYTGAVTSVWKTRWGYFQTIEQKGDESGHRALLRLSKRYMLAWSELRLLQQLFGDEW